MDVGFVLYCSFYGLVLMSSYPSDDLKTVYIPSALLLSRDLECVSQELNVT